MALSRPEIVPVVLSGGFGTRLWPASRARHPKQLLPLVGDETMMKATLDRVVALEGTTDPIVVCNEGHRSGLRRELIRSGLPTAVMYLEPVARNTAPAAAVAALDLTSDGADPLLFVLPADHVIRNEEAFAETVAAALPVAAGGRLLTFGATPTSPETGYGYIRFGPPVATGVREVVQFTEKPDRSAAEAYLLSGAYLWNSGMFLFRASTYLEELERHEPDVLAAARRALAGAVRAGAVVRLDAEAFAASPSISIDYAVMERTDRAAVAPLHAGWSDVGSWSALWQLSEHDAHGNVLRGEVEALDTTNSYVRADGRLVATLGLNNVIVVDTPDALLVTRRDRAQDVKLLVDRLREERRPEVETDGCEDRPWGRFVTLHQGPGYRVLHMWLDGGGKTSLQTHDHRSEYWIVIRGVARIRIGDVVRLVPERESVFVPAGEIHRLENPHATDTLEIIEVDVGTYVGEDDITRFADVYGRARRRG